MVAQHAQVLVPTKPFQPSLMVVGKAWSLPYRGTPVANVIKTFYGRKPFQSSLMFAGKAGVYPSEAPFRCSTLG